MPKKKTEQETPAACACGCETKTNPDLVACLHGAPAGEKDADRAAREARLAAFRRETVQRPAIFVGAGTCGLGAGAGKTLKALRAYLEKNEVAADVVEVGCIGLCAAEPMVDIQTPGKARVSFSAVTEEKIGPLLDQVLAGTIPPAMVIGQMRNEKHAAWPGVPFLDEHPFFKPQVRRVLVNCGVIDPASVEEYVARGGYAAFTKMLKSYTPAEVCNMVELSGLRGRGGGGFPTGRKWKFAQGAAAEQKYLVCNADEGDPGAFMNRAEIEGDPHRLLEGMAIAAYAIGATKAYIYIRAEYPLAIERLKLAMEQAKAYGLLGHNILDSGFDLDIIIKQGAGAFVCGEETALIHSIEGKRGMPRPRPPFPAVQGLFGKPTVINNVETFYNVTLVLANGPEWFAKVGSEKSKGTKVFALSGKVNRTGLVEVPIGTPIRTVIFDAGGGIPGGKQFKAVQVGGPSGGCIPAQHVDVGIDYESMQAYGAIMGSGGLVVMDEGTCMVDLAKFFMDFIQRESCGKCIPCREGTRRLLEILQRITRGRGGEKGADALERFEGVMYMNRLAEVIKDSSLCGLGQTAPNPVLSTLRYFREEYEAHVFERRCPAGVCTDLMKYKIEAAKCKGCTACAKKCPAGAIMGAPKSPHYIISEKCVSCGACLATCKFGAVVRE